MMSLSTLFDSLRNPIYIFSDEMVTNSSTYFNFFDKFFDISVEEDTPRRRKKNISTDAQRMM